MNDKFSFDFTTYEATVLLDFIERARKAGVAASRAEEELIAKIQSHLQEKNNLFFKNTIDDNGTDENGLPYRG